MSSGHKPLTPAMPVAAEPRLAVGGQVFVDGRYISADTFARMGASPQEASAHA